MACFKEPLAQFGKIPARTPFQPLLFLLAPLVATGIGLPASIPSWSLISWARDIGGKGWGEAGVRKGRHPCAASPAAGLLELARPCAPSRPGAPCPSPRGLIPVPRTPCSLCSGAHPTLCLWALPVRVSIPMSLWIPMSRPPSVHPVSPQTGMFRA